MNPTIVPSPLKLVLLASLTMAGCAPPTTTPTQIPAASKKAPAPAPLTASTPDPERKEPTKPIVKPPLPEKVILDGSVLKNTNSGWKLDSQGMEILHRAADKMTSCGPGVIAVVSGYSSSTGARAKNIIISRHRAEFIAKILARMGVPPENITVKSLGSSKPVADNATHEGRLKNQRVEIEFQKP